MIKVPMFFGVICKRTPKSIARIEEVRSAHEEICQQLNTRDRRDFDEDIFLASWSCGMNGIDLSFELKYLKELGLVEGEDFIVTSGGIPKTPWLSYSKETNEVSFAMPKKTKIPLFNFISEFLK